MSRIAPCLWFAGRAEEAARFYTSLFPDSRVDDISRSPADNPSTAAGEVLLVFFTLSGQQFIGVNGGPQFPFTEAVSFQIDCEDQAEVDRYWEALVEGGGEHGQCGLAQGPLRSLVAGRSPGDGRVARWPGPAARCPSDAGDAPDAEARRREAARGHEGAPA